MSIETPPLPYAQAIRYDGAMSERELGFLYGVATSMPPDARVVEIGSWKGRSSVAICQGLTHVPGARFVAVDPWQRKSLLNYERYPADDPERDTIYQRFLRNTGPYEFVEAKRTTSVEAAGDFEAESIDWIFIDGDHSYPAVRADLRAWYPKVKPDGLISGHDHLWRSVRWAVAAHFARIDVWERNIWHVRKTGATLPTRPHALATGATLMHGRAMMRRALRRGV